MLVKLNTVCKHEKELPTDKSKEKQMNDKNTLLKAHNFNLIITPKYIALIHVVTIYVFMLKFGPQLMKIHRLFLCLIDSTMK